MIPEEPRNRKSTRRRPARIPKDAPRVPSGDDTEHVAAIPLTDAEIEHRRKAAGTRRKKFKGIQTTKKVVTTGLAGGAVLAGTMGTVSQADGPFHAGSDRWNIKTSVQSNPPLSVPKNIDIKVLENLPPPAVKNKPDFASSIITIPVSTPSGEQFQEGQIVTTDGYVHLVAFEDGDSDYHIQMNEKPTNDLDNLEPCVIVEVPHPEATEDPALRAQFAKVRKFLRDNCFAGDSPHGKVAAPIRVRVTGQLFFDLHHSTKSDPGGGRGKSLGKGLPMHATTVWEIHPITDMMLAP